MCYPNGSELVFKRLGTKSENKELIILDGLKHELYRESKEDGGENVIKLTADFFDKYLEL